MRLTEDQKTIQELARSFAETELAPIAAQIDQEVVDTVRTAHEKAIGILQENMEALHRLAHYLLEKETITGEEFMSLLEKT